MSFSKTMKVSTKFRDEFKDITGEVEGIVKESGVKDGYLIIFVPHTTAAVTINENADPDVVRDLLYQLDNMVPWSNNYRHFEGNTAAHLKSSMMGFSETVLIENNRLVLGTWQGIYFTEFDGPRKRSVRVTVFG